MIYLNSDTLYVINGLQNSLTGDYVNDATVVGSLIDIVSSSVLATFDFNYTGTAGTYSGVIDQATANTYCIENAEYKISVVASVIDGGVVTFEQSELAGFAGFSG